MSPVPDPRDDLQLVQAWRGGDRAAGAELLTRHFDAIFGFFRTKLAAQAEDLTQQTFLRCVESREVLRGHGVRTYLWAIARNLLCDHLRAGARRPELVDFDVVSLADLDPDPAVWVVEREEHKLLIHALRRLPLDLQLALELYYVQQLRGPEVAAVLGVPLGTGRSRVRRGIERLQREMEALSNSPQHVRTTLTDLQRWASEVRGCGTV